MANNARDWIAGAAAKIVEVILRNEGGDDVIFAMPAEARGIENAALQLDKADGTEAQLPKRASGVKKIEMRGEARSGDGARHGEAIFEKRPVEGFAVESDENGAVGEARGEFMKERVLLGKIAHEKLFYLQTAGVPPGDAYEKGISAGAAGEAGGFCIQEKPLRGIFKSGACAAG